MMHADPICYHSTLGHPKTARTKDMGLLDRGYIPLYFHLLKWNRDKQSPLNKSHLPITASFQCLQRGYSQLSLD